MIERRRIFFLILIMTLVALIVGGIAIVLLYRTALEEERVRLVETAQSQARLLEAIARFGAIHSQDYPGGAAESSLSQIRDAHEHYDGFGNTGEFTLARLEGDQIVFLLKHRHSDLDILAPVPFDSDLAEPMRRALSGHSGTVIGLDYRGAQVLAAYEPVAELDLGIVAKIDMAEIRSPFVKAGLIAGISALVIVFAGAYLFLRISEPILAQLAESEVRYRNLFETVPVGINRTTPEGQILDANQALIDMLKYPDKKTLLKVNVKDLYLNPQDRIQWQERIVQEQVVQGFEAQYHRYDGNTIWACTNARAIFDEDGQVQYYEGSLEDITERKQAKETLRVSDERYRKAQATGHVGSWEYNIQTTEFWGSPEAKRIYGFDPEQMDFSTDEVESCIPERERVHQALVDLIEADKPYNLEFEIIPKNSSKSKIITSIAELERDEHGNPFLVTGVIQDITDRKRAEEALRVSHKKYRVLFESNPLGITITDKSGKIVEANLESERLLDIHRDEQTQREYDGPEWQIVRPDGTPMPTDEYASVRALRENRLIENVEMGIVKDKGDITWISVTAAPIPLEDYGVAITYGDITERKQGEEEKQQLLDRVIKDANELEKRVRERTEQYQIIIDATVGRELRMIELKKVIRKLRKQLKGAGMEPVADDPLAEYNK